MNTALWPYNPDSSTVDAHPQWDLLESIRLTPHILGQLSQDDCKRLMDSRAIKAWRSLSPQWQTVIQGRAQGIVATPAEEDSRALTPVEVMAISTRMLEVETSRATIPVEGLLQEMLSAIKTGTMHGAPISARDKIDIMKFLINKILPDAKNVDTEQKGAQADRKTKKVSAMSRDEIGRLSREDLLARLAEEELKQ